MVKSEKAKSNYVTVISPKKGWVWTDFGELFHYRDLLYFLIWRDIKVRYKETTLGIAWAVIQPLTTMIVLSVIFGRWVKMSSEGYPYPIFVYAALVPWTFFANSIAASANSVLASSNLVTKVYFPRLIIPMASVGVGILDFIVSFIVMLGLMLHYGMVWKISLLSVPFLFASVFFTALGVGILFSALIVAYRDLRHVVTFALQIWMYLTPIVYSPTLFPPKWQWVLNLNPMAGPIQAFRSAFVGRPFDGEAFLTSFCVSLLIFIVGISYFNQVQKDFADIL